MKTKYCKSCKKDTPHTKDDKCNVCKFIDLPYVREYAIPPTKDNISMNHKEDRVEGFKSNQHVLSVMSKTTQRKNLTKAELSALATKSPKLALAYLQGEQERNIPESLEKQSDITLKKTEKGATFKSFVTEPNLTYLNAHKWASYRKPSPDEEHPERKVKGFVFCPEEHVNDVVEAFKATGTNVFWMTLTPA